MRLTLHHKSWHSQRRKVALARTYNDIYARGEGVSSFMKQVVHGDLGCYSCCLLIGEQTKKGNPCWYNALGVLGFSYESSNSTAHTPILLCCDGVLGLGVFDFTDVE